MKLNVLAVASITRLLHNPTQVTHWQSSQVRQFNVLLIAIRFSPFQRFARPG